MDWVRFVRRLIVGAVLIYAAVSLLLGGGTMAKPVLRILLATWLVALAWCSRRRPLPASRGFVLVEVVLANVAFVLLFSELTLRAYAACSGDLYWVAATLEAHRLIPGHHYGGGLRGNALGYPGRDFVRSKPPGTIRIAALGDSFAVGCAVPARDNFLTRLEARLPDTEVYNFGVSGAGPREYLSILNVDVLPFVPDHVLVNIFVGNDITEMLPTPRSLDVRGHAIWQFAHRSLRLLEETQRRRDDPVTEQPLSIGVLSEQTFREVECRRLEICLCPVSPAMEKKWRRFFGYLEAIVHSCQRRGVPVSFVLIPDEFQTNPRVLDRAMRDRDVHAASIDLDLPQRRISQWCAVNAVPCLDLKPLFAADADCYTPRDTHWNVAGHHLAADAIATWLRGLR